MLEPNLWRWSKGWSVNAGCSFCTRATLLPGFSLKRFLLKADLCQSPLKICLFTSVQCVSVAFKDVHISNAWTAMVLVSRANRQIQSLVRQFPKLEEWSIWWALNCLCEKCLLGPMFEGSTCLRYLKGAVWAHIYEWGLKDIKWAGQIGGLFIHTYIYIPRVYISSPSARPHGQPAVASRWASWYATPWTAGRPFVVDWERIYVIHWWFTGIIYLDRHV